MTSLTYYRRALANGLHEDGLPLLLWRILVKLVSPLARIGIDLLYERDLTGEIPLVKARVEATLRHATEADVDAIIALRGPIRGHPVRPSQEGPQDAFGSAEEGEAELREKYLDRLRRGEICFLAFVGSELVAWDWICRTWGEAVPGHPVVPLPDEVYGADAVTAPAWRQRDLHKLLNTTWMRYAQRIGCRRALTMAHLEVWRSHRNLRRLGWQLSGIVFWLVLRKSNKIVMFRLWGKWEMLFNSPAS